MTEQKTFSQQVSNKGEITILTEPDGMEFHIHRECLNVIDTIVLPPVTNDETATPTIIVNESGKIWSHLVPMLNFTEEPTITNIELIHELLKTAAEYKLTGMPSRMRYALLQPSLLEKEPFQIYILARAYALPDVALAAARVTLRLPSAYPFFNALRDATAADYHSLLAYRRRCGESGSALARGTDKQPLPEWIANDETLWSRLAITCHGPCASASQTLLVQDKLLDESRLVHVRIRDAWIAYLKALQTKLEEQPDASWATAPELLEPIITSAAGCAECGKKIYGDAVAISRIMESKLSTAISQVSVEMVLQ